MQHDFHAASDTCNNDSCVLPPPETLKRKLLPYDGADSDERSAKRTKFRDNVEGVSTGEHAATHITQGAIEGKVMERGREKPIEELGKDKKCEEEAPVSLCRSSRKGTTESIPVRIEYKGPCDGMGRPVVVDGLARGAPKGGKNPKRPSERVNFENAFLPASHRTNIEALALRVLPRTSQALARINPKIENKEEIQESAPALISLDTRLNTLKPAHIQREHNPSQGASKWGEGTCLQHLTNWCRNSDKCERGIHPKIRVFVNHHQDPRTHELRQPQTVLHMSHAVPEWERILQSAKDANGNTLLKRILDPSPTTSPTLAPTCAAPAPPPRMCRKQCAPRSPTPPLPRSPQDFHFRHPTPPLPHTQMCVVKTEILNKNTPKRGGGTWTSVTPLPVNLQTIVAALLGLGVKASAFAIDDTQPGSIALQKRLEFCCAMSRPCSEETVDELVEKEVSRGHRSGMASVVERISERVHEVRREHTKTSLVRDESGKIVQQDTTTEIITEVVTDRVIERVIFEANGRVSRSGGGEEGGGRMLDCWQACGMSLRVVEELGEVRLLVENATECKRGTKGRVLRVG